MITFEKPGKENTENTIKVAKQEALKRNIKYVVVASTTGETGILAAKEFYNTGIKLIVVTHNFGFKKESEQEFSPNLKTEIEKLGGTVYTGTMVLRGIGRAIRDKTHYSQEEIVANTLRIFGQGLKVCVEMVCMVYDAGLIPQKDVISVAGTARGADTACIIKPNSSNNFFNLKVREILAKPREF
jgi:hypothetical protein